MVESPNCDYLFVVDTEQYSGNFERPMCAYMTGKIGDCCVGDDITKVFEEEVGEENFDIVSVADEHGSFRPVTIWPTPGWFNHGFGGNFKDQPDQEAPALEHRNQRYREEGDKKPYQSGGDANEKHHQRWYDKQQEPLQKHPAYQSVAICFNTIPTDAQITLMKDRALKYITISRPYQEQITITGFRLIKLLVNREQIGQWDA